MLGDDAKQLNCLGEAFLKNGDSQSWLPLRDQILLRLRKKIAIEIGRVKRRGRGDSSGLLEAGDRDDLMQSVVVFALERESRLRFNLQKCRLQELSFAFFDTVLNNLYKDWVRYQLRRRSRETLSLGLEAGIESEADDNETATPVAWISDFSGQVAGTALEPSALNRTLDGAERYSSVLQAGALIRPSLLCPLEWCSLLLREAPDYAGQILGDTDYDYIATRNLGWSREKAAQMVGEYLEDSDSLDSKAIAAQVIDLLFPVKSGKEGDEATFRQRRNGLDSAVYRAREKLRGGSAYRRFMGEEES